MPTNEQMRLEEARTGAVAWKKWGPYLSERQWGTVREDYSHNGDAWNFFTHDHARSRAYRWGEDGLAGISHEKQQLCFALALWNGKDPILKERLFGLTNSEGNHGEDVKEYDFDLDSTPTHSYMKFLYKYPHEAYPYADLVETNRRRNRDEMEYELLDTGVFRDDRYFDVFVEYAKGAAEDILVRITAANRGPDAAELHLLPTLWFRNDWSKWIAASNRASEKPNLKQIEAPAGVSTAAATHPLLGAFLLSCEGDVPLLFTWVVEHGVDHGRRVARLDPPGVRGAQPEAERIRSLPQVVDPLRGDGVVVVGRGVQRAPDPGRGEAGERKVGRLKLIVGPTRPVGQVPCRDVPQSWAELVPRAGIGARPEMAARAGLNPVAAYLHVPEERFAQRQRRLRILDEVPEVGWPRNRHPPQVTREVGEIGGEGWIGDASDAELLANDLDRRRGVMTRGRLAPRDHTRQPCEWEQEARPRRAAPGRVLPRPILPSASAIHGCLVSVESPGKRNCPLCPNTSHRHRLCGTGDGIPRRSRLSLLGGLPVLPALCSRSRSRAAISFAREDMEATSSRSKSTRLPILPSDHRPPPWPPAARNSGPLSTGWPP